MRASDTLTTTAVTSKNDEAPIQKKVQRARRSAEREIEREARRNGENGCRGRRPSLSDLSHPPNHW